MATVLPGLAMQNLSVPSSTIAGTTAKVTWKTTERDAPNNVTHFTLFLMGKNGPFDLEAVLKYDVEVKLEKTTVLLPGDIDTRCVGCLVTMLLSRADAVYR